MARPTITIYYGADLSNPDGNISLNDGTSYNARTVGLFATPENQLDLGDTGISTPTVNRTKTKERVFSLLIDIVSNSFVSSWVTLKNALERVLYLEDLEGKRLPVRIVVPRNGVGSLYVDAICEIMHPVDDVDLRKYEILFTAVDPYLTDFTTVGTISGNTGTNPASYPDFTLPSYPGTAPSEPTFTFEIGAHGGVYRYYRDITVTNNAPFPLVYYPICIDLGDIRASVGTKFHEVSGFDRRIVDIRVETQHGTRKVIFIRDSGDSNPGPGGTWHQDVKVWTVLYNLQPGESKVLRVLYGNSLAPVGELTETANATIKSMFNMWNSTNALHQYVDFMPIYTTPQTRARQWQVYLPGSNDISWIGYAHPHFDVGSTGNVPCAGGKVVYYASGASGAAGLQLNCPVPPSSINFTWRVSTNAKDPFVLRSVRGDGRIVDDWTYPNATHNLAKSAITTLVNDVAGGDTLCRVANTTVSGSTFAVGDSIFINKDDGTVFRGTVTSVNSPLVGNIGFTPAMTGSISTQASTGNAVQQGLSGTQVISWPSTDEPLVLAFALRGDSPANTSGDWYYGGADFVEITWDSTKMPSVTAWGSATEVDQAANGYQLKGRFGNDTLGEYLGINTIVSTVNDKIIVDCKARTVQYVHWNGTSYDPPVDRTECLQFDEVRRYWVHVSPNGVTQVVKFIPDSQSLFTSLDVTITIPHRYLS